MLYNWISKKLNALPSHREPFHFNEENLHPTFILHSIDNICRDNIFEQDQKFSKKQNKTTHYRSNNRPGANLLFPLSGRKPE
jgi:hypothetical protein